MRLFWTKDHEIDLRKRGIRPTTYRLIGQQFHLNLEYLLLHTYSKLPVLGVVVAVSRVV